MSRRTRWHRDFPSNDAEESLQATEPRKRRDKPGKSGSAKARWKRPLFILGLIALVVIIAVVLRGKVPKPSEIWNAIVAAEWGWVLLAAATMVLSVFSFAEQQRQLLAAFDTPITRGRITAITFGGTALTNSLPAGAAVSAGYSFRQYRLSGASRSTAATVMVLSGVLSIGSLAVLYFLVIGAATATPFIALLSRHPIVAVLVALLAAAIVLLLIRRTITGPPSEISDAPTPRLDRWEQRWPRFGALARDGLDTLRQARLVKLRYLTLGIGWSVSKWAAEAMSLLAACWAFDVQIDLVALSVIYLSVQLVRQLPLTPGGLGLVEASLLAGLVSAGAVQGAAGAAVLVYRMLSAWLIIPVGFGLLAGMQRRDARRSRRLQPSQP